MTRRRTLSMLLPLLFLGLLSGAARADPPSGDAANSPFTAQTLPPGTYAGSLTTGDEDWYRLAVPALSQASVTLSGCAGLTVEIYQGDGATLVASGGCGSTLSCASTLNQVVYVRVSGAVGDYTLKTQYASTVPLGSFCSL